MNEVVLSLGSNLGNRLHNLQQSLLFIQQFMGSVIKIAPVYETNSWGFSGNNFLNTVLFINSQFSPDEILQKIKKIESLMGRKNKSNYGNYSNRIIDIDLLYYNQIQYHSEHLIIPHPKLHLRNFVLYPLNDILSDFFHPKLQKTNKELLFLSPDKKQPILTDFSLKILPEIPYNYIAIEGNIGAGKTTFASAFAKDYNAKLVLERFEENPFLPKFYEDSERYAFPLEMSFLADRYRQLTDDLAQYDLFKTSVVSDYFVFKSLIFANVTLSEVEYELYRKIFNFMYRDIPKPDLYIYLYQNVERLLENIKKRGRTYEQSISADYLRQIHDGYMNFIKTQKDLNILILDISNIDFVQEEHYYYKMIETIAKRSKNPEKLVIEKI